MPTRVFGRAPSAMPDRFLASVERLRRLNRFAPALARYCRQMSREADAAWPTQKLFDQLDRYVTGYLLIHNYYAWRCDDAEVPTLAALQRVTSPSARHTAGFVSALKTHRFVVAEPDPADARRQRLRPGAEMIRQIGRSAVLFVAAVDHMRNRRPGWAAELDDTDRLGEMVYRSAAFVLGNGTLIHDFPRVLSFAGRDCGYPLLTAIMGAHYAATVAGAPAAVPLTLRALASRFQVSRAHVGNLLDEAARAGWFATGRDGRLAAIDPSLVQEFENWAAWQMVHYDSLASIVSGRQ
ncbi:hypothetical protein [Reyranella sp.]|uniref:hypothetical protein n=1 Tax=Reyranella sp. TaxID=1929291 RepID=UPI003BA98516